MLACWRQPARYEDGQVGYARHHARQTAHLYCSAKAWNMVATPHKDEKRRDSLVEMDNLLLVLLPNEVLNLTITTSLLGSYRSSSQVQLLAPISRQVLRHSISLISAKQVSQWCKVKPVMGNYMRNGFRACQQRLVPAFIT